MLDSSLAWVLSYIDEWLDAWCKMEPTVVERLSLKIAEQPQLIVKSQQRGEPDMSIEERRDAVREVCQKTVFDFDKQQGQLFL